MELVRIGEKVINRERLYTLVDKIIMLRSNGATQQDVADTLDLERPFVSNLERLGEVRIGQKVALVGFSVSNKQEIKGVAKEHGIDSVYLYNGEILTNLLTRTKKVDERGVLQRVLATLAKLRDFDLLLFLGLESDAALLEEALGIQVLSLPVKEVGDAGFYINRQEIESYLEHLIPGERSKRTEDCSKRKFGFFKKGPRGKRKSTR